MEYVMVRMPEPSWRGQGSTQFTHPQ